MKKRAEFTHNELLEIILVAAGIILLLILFFTFLSPRYNAVDETAKNYYNYLTNSISEADDGGKAEFGIWQNLDNANFYIVYFGNKGLVKEDWLDFSFIPSKGLLENNICICYKEKGKPATCDYCKSLKYPVKLYSGGGWAKGVDTTFIIEKKGEEYLFTTK